ncbi:MAG: sugar transferase [Bacteroidales bacterium]|nr:sugar transferase [Bacteroidales bacterium]
MKPYRDFFKRGIDIGVSSLGLLLLSLPLSVIALWLHFANKGAGVFFLQERPGKNGKIFRIYKFKSMTDQRDEQGHLLPDSKRMTKGGKFVRKTSIDELPQLWNVLKGDMSLIGPRPLLPEYLPYYTEKEMHRHDVRPGITGLAQVEGRNSNTWEETFAKDLEYTENVTFLNDCKILFGTFLNVIKKRDVQAVPTGNYLHVERARLQNKN